jgi:predicted regulator of Ras-like GTPase activity (Roadblock/LC7/MglB family)
LTGVDTSSALADLSEISSQIEAAVVFDQGGAVLGSTGSDGDRSQRLARTALELISAAEQAGTAGRRLTQIEASLREGSVFVVSDAGRGIAATTTPEPTSGLIFYDLRTCLRSLEDDPGEAAPAKSGRRKKKEAQDA